MIPPATLWAGNPAKKKRDLTPAEVEGLETYWKNYLDYKAEYLRDAATGLPVIASVKGTRDLLPPETRVWNRVEAVAREVFALYGFDEIRTPVLESTELFVRSVGEATDIVHKEMYTFTDRGDRSVTLRPENTAGVARAYVEHSLAQAGGPGSSTTSARSSGTSGRRRAATASSGRSAPRSSAPADAATDAELLVMLFDFLGRLGFTGLSVSLNSRRERGRAAGVRRGLRAFFSSNENAERSARTTGGASRENPLRVLDSKDPAVQKRSRRRRLPADGRPPADARPGVACAPPASSSRSCDAAQYSLSKKILSSSAASTTTPAPSSR